SYDISHIKTKQREIKSLQEGMAYFNLNEALLLTSDHEEEIKIGNQTIIIQPLWKWLLRN
ncbi:MAG: ATP-binding protein, partial [Pseudomonadota bacterium]|nr:ATP-binding protein [Pseudomonadota bacterium]